MKSLVTIALVVFLASPAFAAGGLECVNDDLPTPMCSQPTPVQTVPMGFGETASLSTTVNAATGNVKTYFAAGGAFPLARPLAFCHSSRDNRTFPMGIGRNHSYNIVLLERPDEWAETPIRIVNGNGGRVNFDQNMDGTYRGQPGVFSRLIKQLDGSYRLFTNESSELVDDGNVCYDFGPADSSGRARLRSVNFEADSYNISYVTSGYGVGEIHKVRETSTGLEVVFEYDSLGKIKKITSLDGVATTFTYNALGALIQAQSGWGTLTFDVDADYNIRMITDGPGGHSASITYIDTSRGTSFMDTNGVIRDFNYNLNGFGSVTFVSFGVRGSVPTSFEITPNLLVSSVTTPEGSKTCYNYSPDRCSAGSSVCKTNTSVKVANASAVEK